MSGRETLSNLRRVYRWFGFAEPTKENVTTQSRPPKKTEQIEIRVSPELKDAVGRLSEARRQSMSETIRDALARELNGSADTSNQSEGLSMTKFAQSPVARYGAIAASILALAGVYSFTAQGVAVASVGAEARITFAEADLNDDGLITRDEFAARIAFEREEDPEEIPVVPEACIGTFIADEIAEEAAELTAPPDDAAAARLALVDTDRDGGMSFEELEAFIYGEKARDFIDYDMDENGYVTLDEVKVLLAQEDLDEERAALAEEGLSAACIDAVIVENPFHDDVDPKVVLAEFDIDRDGRVSLMEYLEH